MKSGRTLNGKHDARCHHCLRHAYALWVSDEPPPTGCAEGQDADISKCGHVYAALVSVVIREDHLKKPLTPEQEYLIKLLGPKAGALLAPTRSGAIPPSHKPKEPIYDQPPSRAN